MQPTVEHRGEVGSAMRVRQNIAPAAIGAAFLLYFGFFQLTEPTGTDLFGRANWVFYYTLRLGGLAMAAIAAWSLRGQPITLAVDAVVTVAIGVLLILSGLGMAVDGGAMVQTIINVVCGGMFISSGVRNWRDYRLLATMSASIPTPIPTAPSPSQREGGGEGKLHRKTIVLQREKIGLPRESGVPIAPPPEGFLASLAKKPPPPTDDEGPST